MPDDAEPDSRPAKPDFSCSECYAYRCAAYVNPLTNRLSYVDPGTGRAHIHSFAIPNAASTNPETHGWRWWWMSI